MCFPLVVAREVPGCQVRSGGSLAGETGWTDQELTKETETSLAFILPLGSIPRLAFSPCLYRSLIFSFLYYSWASLLSLYYYWNYVLLYFIGILYFFYTIIGILSCVYAVPKLSPSSTSLIKTYLHSWIKVILNY